MIESGFNPVAVSRAGAKGLWQFMAPTARRYGLRVDAGSTSASTPRSRRGRPPPTCGTSTRCSARGTSCRRPTTPGRCGSCGPSGHGHERFLAARAEQPILTNETKNYVAAIQAAKVIAREPDRYGFSVTPDAPLRYENVHVPRGDQPPVARPGHGRTRARLPGAEPGAPAQPDAPGGALRAAACRQAPARGSRPPWRAASRPPWRGRSPPAQGREGGNRSGSAVPSRIHVVKPNETLAGHRPALRSVRPAELQRWNQPRGRRPHSPGDRLRVARRGARGRTGRAAFGEGGAPPVRHARGLPARRRAGGRSGPLGPRRHHGRRRRARSSHPIRSRLPLRRQRPRGRPRPRRWPTATC